MGSVIRVLGIIGVVIGAMLAAAWSAVVAAVVPLAAVTGLVMGGTGWPLMPDGPIGTPNEATKDYLAWTKSRYIERTLSEGDTYSGSVAVWSPEEFWPLPNQQLTFNKSVMIGLNNLTVCLVSNACTYNRDVGGASPFAHGPEDGQRYLVFGYSQSARIATNLKQSIVGRANAVEQGWDNVPKMDFVLIGNPNRPNGGILQRFVGLQIPFFGISMDGATPTNSPKDDDGTHRLATTDYSAQYDGYSDFPLYPLNLLADLNALAGIFAVHGSYHLIDMDGMFMQGEAFGDTQYYMIPTTRLPLLSVVEDAIPDPVGGWLRPVFTLLEAPLRAMIETGYDRNISPGSPEHMRLVRLNPIDDALTVGYAIGIGIDDALAQVTGNPTFRPLGTKPNPNPYGVTEIKLKELIESGASALGVKQKAGTESVSPQQFGGVEFGESGGEGPAEEGPAIAALTIETPVIEQPVKQRKLRLSERREMLRQSGIQNGPRLVTNTAPPTAADAADADDAGVGDAGAGSGDAAPGDGARPNVAGVSATVPGIAPSADDGAPTVDKAKLRDGRKRDRQRAANADNGAPTITSGPRLKRDKKAAISEGPEPADQTRPTESSERGDRKLRRGNDRGQSGAQQTSDSKDAPAAA